MSLQQVASHEASHPAGSHRQNPVHSTCCSIPGSYLRLIDFVYHSTNSRLQSNTEEEKIPTGSQQQKPVHSTCCDTSTQSYRATTLVRNCNPP